MTRYILSPSIASCECCNRACVLTAVRFEDGEVFMCCAGCAVPMSQPAAVA